MEEAEAAEAAVGAEAALLLQEVAAVVAQELQEPPRSWLLKQF